MAAYIKDALVRVPHRGIQAAKMAGSTKVTGLCIIISVNKNTYTSILG